MMSKFSESDAFKRSEKTSSNSDLGAQNRDALENLNENCSVLQNFKVYAKELDKRHDKFERLIKLSRDITIESKRIIFLLHSMDRESKKVSIMQEAQKRLETLISHQWKSVAIELQNEDPYLFHKAFSPGMQEFVEAFTFFNYLNDNKFLHWNNYQGRLQFNRTRQNIQVCHSDNLSDTVGTLIKKEEDDVMVILIPLDYILGLADVTGELMRKCINNLVEGDIQSCYLTCDVVRNLYSEFLSIGLSGNEKISRKMFTLRQSLLKMEMVCYNIHVRGTEVPGYILANVNSQKTYPEKDERFF